VGELATVCAIWAAPFVIWGAFVVVHRVRKQRAEFDANFDAWVAKRNADAEKRQ
jgi:hypothetical protein